MVGVDVLNKVLFVLFFLCTSNVIRNLFFLIRSVRNSERFVMGKKSLFLFGISISYILMTIFTGITL